MAGRGSFSAEARSSPDFIVSRNAAVKEARGLGINVEGLRELRRDLKRLHPTVEKELRKELKKAVQPVLDDARKSAPSESGALRRSLRASVTMRGVSIGSTLPYAGLVHWGGSTGKGHKPGVPWSGSILVRESLFLSKALDRNEDAVIEAMGDAVDAAARACGWR